MAGRPNRYPSFCTAPAAGAIVEFPAGTVAGGFVADQRPAAQWFNYAFNLWGGWINFLRGPSPTNYTRRPWSLPGFDSEVLLAADRWSVETTAAVFRHVIAGRVSGVIKAYGSRRGVEWVDQSASLPGGLTANPVLGLAAVLTLNISVPSVVWYLWTDAQLAYAVAGTTAAPAWALATLPGGYKPRGVASSGQLEVVMIAETGGALVWAWSTNATTFSAGGLSGTPTGAALGVVWTGAQYVMLTATGEVWRTPDRTNAAKKDATITASSAWRLAAGATGEVVAYEVGVTSTRVRRSTDHGANWASVAIPSEVRNLTKLAYIDGGWIASTTEAPYIWTSNDLATWVRGVVPVPEAGALPVLDLAYAEGQVLGAGNQFVYGSHRAADAGPGTADGIANPVTLADAAYLRGRLISSTAPTDGQVYAYDLASNTWKPTTISATVAAPLTLTVDDATTNAVTDVLFVRHTTSGTAASGIGAGVVFQGEDGAGNVESAARVAGVLTSVVNGAEDGALVFQTRSGGGALTERARLGPLGGLSIGTTTSPGFAAVALANTVALVGLNATASGWISLAYVDATNRPTFGTTGTRSNYLGGACVAQKRLIASDFPYTPAVYDYAMVATDTTAARVINLPAAPANNTAYIIKHGNNGANNVTINRGGSDTINSSVANGATSYTLTPGSILTLIYDSTAAVWEAY